MKVSIYKQESSKEMTIEQIFTLVTHKELYPEVCLHLSAHNDCADIVGSTGKQLACTMENLLDDLRAYLNVSSTKTGFGIETDSLLNKLPATEKRKMIKKF